MKNSFRYVGPGIVVAATGIGAGDMIAASVGGSSYGYTIIWAVLIGAILKYVLNEGVGRWQLTSGISITDAWINKLPRIFPIYFLVYLVLWSVIVAAALIAATGLAAHSIWPILSINEWGIIHSIVALVFVLWGKYRYFELVMKYIIAMLFLIVVVSVIIIKPDLNGLLSGMLLPQIKEGSATYIMAIMGGVGGSVTLLSYGYWISEKNWKGSTNLYRIRIDLATAYVLTAIFGVAIIIIAANLKPDVVRSNQIVIALANQMKLATGEMGKLIFLLGFWGAVTSSMLGVWQGIPYLFSDFVSSWKKEEILPTELSNTNYYKLYLVFLAIPPITLLYFQKPVWLIMIYSIAGALFMPFMAITLLWLNNNKKWVTKDKNSLITNILLVLTLCLFAYLAILEVVRLIN